MKELKNCPFCGKNPELNRIKVVSEWMYEVRCPWCGCGTDACTTKEEAMGLWNKRFKDGD